MENKSFKEEFINRIRQNFFVWIQLMENEKIFDGKRYCENQINNLKPILKNRTLKNATCEDYNLILYEIITYKAFLDFSELNEIILQKDWNTIKDKIEFVWLKHWDCRERLEFVKLALPNEITQVLFKNLNSFLSEFQINFNDGIYASPEILVKKESCSICRKDLRVCNHLKGKAYDGKICRGIAREYNLINISLVINPKDYRCRIWAWNKEENGTYKAILMNLSNIEDFIYEED